VENIGAGPALNAECSVRFINEYDPPKIPVERAGVAAIAVGRLEPFLVSCILPVVMPFALTLEYDDVAGKSWKTTCLLVDGQYEGMSIESCKRTHRLQSGMVKPVLPGS
jgi:hypothetical protein